MILDSTKPEAVTKETGEAVIRAVLDYITSTGKKRTAVARALGISPPVLSQVLSWKYPGLWQQVVVDLDRWLEEECKREAAPRTTEFVWTKTALEILAVADAATTLKTIGLVCGPKTSGVGKSLALQAIAAEKPGSILVTIETLTSSKVQMLRAIAKAMRIPDCATWGNSIYERIKEKLRDTPRLLIVDDIHNLCGVKNDLPLFVLKDLHNETGAPQLWAGTTDIVAYLNQGQGRGRQTLAQIRSRIGICRDLLERTRKGDGGMGEPLFTIDEVRRIYAKAPMRLAPDAARYLLMLANHPDSGALRLCKNLVVMATTIHAGEATILTADMLRSAHRMLVTGPTFRRLEAEIEEDQHMPMAKIG